MNSFYDKRETDEKIEYEFHFMPLVSVLFFLLVIASLSPGGRCTGRIRPLCALLLIVWMVGLFPAWMELENAMRRGPVTVSGSKFSCKYPLKVVITKK